MTENFKIKTDRFEGPLDLLLNLIEKRKLHISDVSLSKVTDDYIHYIEKFDNLPMGESAQFILIASTLLLIKSKSLLPALTLTEEEQEGIYDLEKRLKIYKKIKEAGQAISEQFGKEIIFRQSQRIHIDPIFSPHESMKLEGIRSSLLNLIRSFPKKEQLPQAIVRKVMSLEDMMGSLADRITKSLRLSFKEFTSEHKEERVNVIVGFLAMLELVKQGIVYVSQEETFGDINIETNSPGVPRYT